MKTYILVLIIICLPFLQINAQISSAGTPPSFSILQTKQNSSPDYILPKIKNLESILEEDKQNPYPFRYSIVEKTNINIKEKGISLIDKHGNKIWKYYILSEEAVSLGLIFNKFNLPEGAKLFIYSPDHKTILGAFTNKNNKKSGKLHIQELKGKEAIIEYFEPKEPEFYGELVLGGIGQAYKSLFDDLPDTAFIDINCPIGDEWQLEKHSVVKYTSQQGSAIVSCTGFLVNNTNNDGRPYMLTANHCMHQDSDAENLVAYFNFEAEDCQSDLTLFPLTLSEATLLATNSSYDFTLVELSETPPPNYQPYYAGWSTNPNPTEQATSIHHPAGNEKSISIDYDSIQTYSATINLQDGNRILTIPGNSAWVVDFDRGRTIPGSSGSPLFDPNKRVIGLLSAGTSTINLDYYIKLSRAYKPFNAPNDEQLKHWLDPTGSNVSFIDGYVPYPNETPPDAHFTVEYRGVCQGSELQLKDRTTFYPSSWQWEFTPNTVTFIEGTDTSQNPIVKFDDFGEYDVTLTVGNSSGNNVQTRSTYISTKGLDVKIRQMSYSSFCFENFNEVRFKASGAETYHWYVEDTAVNFIELQGENTDTVIVNFIDENKPDIDIKNLTDSLVTFKLFIEGTIDSCTSVEEFEIKLLFHSNDDVADAYPLTLDTLQGPFDNTCATVEENEPIPEVGECTNQGEWCGCELGNDYRFILSNSTWFTFIAPESGVVGIETFGYDNQIAVYDAESAEDILSDNLARYDIIGANDDFSSTDSYAKIPTLAVTPGKKYWIQADGSACNSTGKFSIRVSSKSLVDIKSNILGNQYIADIYPNPANDFITVKNKSPFDFINISILNIEGKTVYNYHTSEETFILDTKNFARGFYIIQIADKNGLQLNKLILK